MPDPTRNIFIAIPHGGMVDFPFVESLLMLMANNSPQDNMRFSIGGNCSSVIAHNRNMLVKMAYQNKATHLLFIDTDIIFPSDGLRRLLAHDKDIVCATYCKRADDDGKPIGDGDGDAEGNLLPTSYVGLGFMLIKMSVFDKIGMPAFYEDPNYETGNINWEDKVFCKLATEAGLKIWIDWPLSLEIGHIGKKAFYIKPSAE